MLELITVNIFFSHFVTKENLIFFHDFSRRRLNYQKLCLGILKHLYQHFEGQIRVREENMLLDGIGKSACLSSPKT